MFAREPIKKGETVCIVGGTVMTDAEFVAFQATHSLYNSIQIDKNLHLVEDPEITRSLEGSMNHSCDSSSWMGDEVTLVARRDIESGEEVTVVFHCDFHADICAYFVVRRLQMGEGDVLL